MLTSFYIKLVADVTVAAMSRTLDAC